MAESGDWATRVSRWVIIGGRRVIGAAARLGVGISRSHPWDELNRGIAGARHRLNRRIAGARLRLSRPPVRRLGAGIALVVVTLTGIGFGLAVGGHTYQDVGPFEARFSVTPSLVGGTDVQLPPLGSLSVHSHDGPAHITIDLASLDSERTRELFTSPGGVNRASATAGEDVRQGVTRLALQAIAVASLGAMVLAAIVFRSMRRVAICGGLALAVMVASLAVAVRTFRQESIAEPTYEGLLINARDVVGDARKIAGSYDAYREQLQRMVTNVSRLYSTFASLPVYEPPKETIRVLHISDLHLNPAAWSVVQTVVQQFEIDVVVDTGDITDWGSEPEASYVASIGRLGVPYAFIRGNHDSALTAAAVAKQPNAIVLDNTVVDVAGLTIAGTRDPRFTPDKSVEPPMDGFTTAQDELLASGARLAQTIRGHAGPHPVDIAAVHDPASAGPLAGQVPVVLAGHLHQREVRDLEVPEGSRVPRTQLLVEGSTGGAGLRGLESGEPLPLQLSVLYFGQDRALQAYDEISVGGAGQTEVTLQRRRVEPPQPAGTPTTPR
jgi:predicted MPP superfamily phosphohydrolase